MSYDQQDPNGHEPPQRWDHLGTLFVHARWQTRHGKPWLADEDVAQAAQTAIATRARELRCRTLAVGFRPDHLHVVFAFPASQPINRLALTTMDAAARAIARALAVAQDAHVAEAAVWDRHFGLHTVGPETVTETVSYVACQDEHHERGTLRPQWETASHTRPSRGRRRPPNTALSGIIPSAMLDEETQLAPPPDAEDDRPHEECGVFGVYAPGEDVARLAYFGLFALQHRGQESAGIAVSDGEHVKWFKEMGLVTQIFDERTLSQLKGDLAIGHTRYSTTGSSILRNAQPLHCAWGDGTVAVAHNGNLVNTDELRTELEAQGVAFDTTNDSEVIARLIATQQDKTLEDAVAHTMGRLHGAYSVVILTEDTLIGIRDPYGNRPLCLGLLGNKHHVLASETCALATVGAQYVREVEPGEMIVLDRHGMRTRQAQPQVRNATCLLEFIYFARPDSMIYGRGLHNARRRMGHELAREHPVPEADMVMPIPDTGTPAAIGFAEASGIPYGEGVVKNRYIQRTFIQPDQRMREAGVRMKLMPIKESLAGKRVVMVDDSIVRGTTTGQIVRLLFDAGAAEVHVRITAPPVKYPCFYGIDMANQKDLVAAHHTVEEIREMIGATSLGYLSQAGVTRAIGIHKDKFCRACFDGHYPIEIPPHVKASKFALEMPLNVK